MRLPLNEHFPDLPAIINRVDGEEQSVYAWERARPSNLPQTPAGPVAPCARRGKIQNRIVPNKEEARVGTY